MEPLNWAPEHSDARGENLARGLSFFGKSVESDQFEIQHRVFAQCRDWPRQAKWGLTRRKTARKSQLSAKPPSLQRNCRTSVHRTQDALPFSLAGAGVSRGRADEAAMRSRSSRGNLFPDRTGVMAIAAIPTAADEEGEAITFCGHPPPSGFELLARRIFI